MVQGRCSDQSPVARIPQAAVESGGRGVAGQTHVRRWPRTTRCNELAVVVMRDGEPEGRESLIAAVSPSGNDGTSMTPPIETPPGREPAPGYGAASSSAPATRYRRVSARWLWALLLIAASLFPAGVFIFRYQRELRAVHELEAMGVSVQHWSPFPAWVSVYCGEQVLNPFSEVSVIVYDVGMNLGEGNVERLSCALEDLRSVKGLYLADSTIDDNWLSHLKGVSNVRQLVIAGTNISDEGISYLVTWRHLERLVLEGPCERLSNRCLRYLEHMPSLNDLTVQGVDGINEQGISDLKKAKPNLR